MKTKRNFIVEQTSALKNKDVIDVDIYEPDAEDFYEPDAADIYEPDESDIYEPDDDCYSITYEEYLYERLYFHFEYIESLENHLYYSVEAEKNFKAIANTIIRKFGKETYQNIMNVIETNIFQTKQELSEEGESYESLSECYNKYCFKN